jgi:hypothetical protein
VVASARVDERKSEPSGRRDGTTRSEREEILRERDGRAASGEARFRSVFKRTFLALYMSY